GYAELVVWARTLGHIDACAVESTGSYGVGLASDVRRQALGVVEVSHCDRRKRRNNGKSDTLDAESAARSVLAGLATAVPKSGWRFGNGSPDQSRPRYGGKSQEHRDHRPKDAPGEGSVGAAGVPGAAHR